MAENIISDQISDVESYLNNDIKTIISTVTYSDMLSQYLQDKSNFASSDNMSTDMDKWYNDLSKSLFVCCAQNPNGNDNGQYELVITAPDGRPVKLAPSFSEIDTTYFNIETRENAGGYKYNVLTLNMDNIIKEVKAKIS